MLRQAYGQWLHVRLSSAPGGMRQLRMTGNEDGSRMSAGYTKTSELVTAAAAVVCTIYCRQEQAISTQAQSSHVHDSTDENTITRIVQSVVSRRVVVVIAQCQSVTAAAAAAEATRESPR